MPIRLTDDRGFSLVEILVVIAIIAALTAIALPVFIRQQHKGEDTRAQSNARNAATTMETCRADRRSYLGCDLEGSGLRLGTGADEVDLVSLSEDGFVVVSASASGCRFAYRRTAAAVVRDTAGDRCPARTW